MLSVSLLGEVRVERDGRRLDLGSARPRSVFAALALRANQPVSRAELIADVWGDDPPATADGNLYTYVSDLRRVLEPQRSRWSGGQVLTSTDAGYLLRVDPERLDVQRLDALRADAHRYLDASEWARAWQCLTDALALWRGEALTGVSGPFAERHRARLADLQLATREQRAGAALELGRAAEVVGELEPLVRANPRRESLCGLLMTALAMAGRTGDALDVYRRAESVLADELGIDPAPALRRLAQRLEPDVPARVTDTAGTVVGRAVPLARLHERVRALAAGQGGAVWVTGEPGIGKTSLITAAFDRTDGLDVRWGAGDELGSRFPLGLLLESLGAVPFAVDPRRRALAAEVRDTATADAVTAVVAFVERLCGDGPLALVLDDVQWADDATLLAVRKLAAATERLPLLLVAAARPVPRRAEVGAAHAAAMAVGETLVLGPLGPAEVAELAADRGMDTSVLVQAGGNPRYLHQLLDGRPVTARQLTFLSGETRDLLRWAALLGDGFALGDLAVVLDRPPVDLEPGVAEAVAAGVLIADGECYAFRHALLRQACHDATPRAIRRAMHQQAARALAAKVP